MMNEVERGRMREKFNVFTSIQCCMRVYVCRQAGSERINFSDEINVFSQRFFPRFSLISRLDVSSCVHLTLSLSVQKLNFLIWCGGWRARHTRIECGEASRAWFEWFPIFIYIYIYTQNHFTFNAITNQAQWTYHHPTADIHTQQSIELNRERKPVWRIFIASHFSMLHIFPIWRRLYRCEWMMEIDLNTFSLSYAWGISLIREERERDIT